MTSNCTDPVAGISPVVQHHYGISVRTLWPIPDVAPAADSTWDVEFMEAAPQALAEAARHIPTYQADWSTQNASLPDGSRYCRWSNLFEFLVSPDGRRIQVRALKDATAESLQACLLVDALSFSMVRLGREPLHATAVMHSGGIVAFLGKSGEGKSTLGGLFVHAGCRLLADDMLVLTTEANGFLAHPGPPRIKLYRETAQRIFGDAFHGTPMNPVTDKLIIPLDTDRMLTQPAPLRGIYVISSEAEAREMDRPSIRRLSPAEALPRVLSACATHWTYETERLRRQFAFVTRLVQSVPIKTLSYARDKGAMSRVRDAVLADL